MRKFVKIGQSKQMELEDEFPNLFDLVNAEQPADYVFLAVSVFDHWLSNEESLESLHLTPYEEQRRRNSNFNRFNNFLISNTEVVTFRFTGRNKRKPSFREFISDNAKTLYLNHTDMGVYKVVLPAIKAVYLEGHDDTNYFFFRDLSYRTVIEEWASKAGLYCLEPNKKSHPAHPARLL